MYDKAITDEWPFLIAALRAAMQRGLAPHEPTVQRLARHWVHLLRRTAVESPELVPQYDGSQRLEFDIDYAAEIESALFDYLSAALWSRHLTPEEAARLRTAGPRQRDWPRLLAALREEMNRGAPVTSASVQLLYRQWEGGLDELTAGDAALRHKWLAAVRADPAVMTGTGVDARLQNYLRRAQLVQLGWL